MTRKGGSIWRKIATGFCIGLAAVAVTGSILARYVRDEILDTDRYVATVGPLVRTPEVSAALAAYATSKVFDAANAEQNIRDALPPRLAPLAAPLTDVLQKNVNKLAQNIVQSDGFNAIWIAANIAAQKTVVRVGESQPAKEKLAAVSSLDLGGLLQKLRAKVGDQAILTDQQKDKAAAIKLNLQQSASQLRRTVGAVKTSAYVLPYAALALLLVALAVAADRRRAVFGIGIALALAGFIVLVGFRLWSGNMLDGIANDTYRQAAAVIYDALYGGLRARLGITVGIGVVLVLLALASGPYRWAGWLRAKTGLSALARTAFFQWLRAARAFVATYEFWFLLAGIIAAAIWMLALASLGPATFAVTLCVLAAYISLTHLTASDRQY